MKKTLITLLALGSIALGETYVYDTAMVGNANKAAIYGFTFTLQNAAVVPQSGSVATDQISDYTLTSLTLGDRADGKNSGPYGLLVLNSSNVILGMSNEKNTACNGVDEVFTFTDLTLNAATTYRFVTVDTSLFNSEHIGLTYAYGKETTLTETETSVSGGLQNIGVAVDNHPGKDTPGLALTGSETFGTLVNMSPILTNITVTVPEPTTATLSLLALAGLAVRRRRK